jgi:hypothetical protein
MMKQAMFVTNSLGIAPPSYSHNDKLCHIQQLVIHGMRLQAAAHKTNQERLFTEGKVL